MQHTDNPEEPFYQLYVYSGPGEMPAISDVSVVRLSPRSAAPADVVAALTESGLTAADLRTRALFLTEDTDLHRCLASYAALCGFAGRPLDFSDTTEVVQVRPLYEQMSALQDLPVLEPAPETMVLGRPGDPDVTEALTPELAAAIRSVKHLYLHPAGEIRRNLETLAVCNALRVRNNAERFPILVPAGSDTFDPQDDSQLQTCTDLDQVRKDAASARRDRRIDDRGALVEPAPRTSRQELLLRAATLPVDDVLRRLGSTVNDEGLWRCPRPERHRNGDANPSAKIVEGRFRCFRCDLEHVDPLRLVMDCLALCPDDSAAWLLSDTRR